MKNLNGLIDQWIDKQISKYNESIFIMQHNTGVLDMLDDQISALQDLKSRKQELIYLICREINDFKFSVPVGVGGEFSTLICSDCGEQRYACKQCLINKFKI